MYSLSLSTVCSTLAPDTWPFSLEWLPRPAYLVGGIVRDALLGRQTAHLDLDFVMPSGAVETARKIAHHYKAGFVLLDAERQIARVVFDQATADFAQQVGPTLESDLQRRDFTVNAIAYNPHTEDLIDPLRGYIDLQKGLLRMVAAENLQEDPLRLLRAYRQAAQLGFTLEAETQTSIRQFAPLLRKMAAERVQAELSYLLSTPKGTPWLTAACQDGLLEFWFPHVTPESLELIAGVDRAALILNEARPDFAALLCRWIREKGKGATDKGGDPSGQTASKYTASPGCRRTWLSTAKLVSLLSTSPPIAEAEMLRLKYSRAEIQAVTTILKCLPQIPYYPPLASLTFNEPLATVTTPSRRDQYFFFQGVGGAFPAVAVLGMAAGLSLEAIAPLLDRFLTPDDPVAHPKLLVTGQDLMSHLQLTAGPQIGQLLAKIQLAQAEGQVTNGEEALEFARELMSSDSTDALQ